MSSHPPGNTTAPHASCRLHAGFMQATVGPCGTCEHALAGDGEKAPQAKLRRGSPHSITREQAWAAPMEEARSSAIRARDAVRDRLRQGSGAYVRPPRL